MEHSSPPPPPGLEAVAAKVCAAPAVSAAPERERGKETQPAVRIAQRAVNERFNFDAGHAGAIPYLAERQLARQGRAREAEPGRHLHARAVVNRHLRTRVQTQFRKMAPRQPHNAQVLRYHRVRAKLGNQAQRLGHARQLVIPHQGVQRDIHAAPWRKPVRVSDEGIGLFRSEIHSLRARGKTRQPDIDRVRAVAQRGVRGLRPAGGRQQFGAGARRPARLRLGSHAHAIARAHRSKHWKLEGGARLTGEPRQC